MQVSTFEEEKNSILVWGDSVDCFLADGPSISITFPISEY